MDITNFSNLESQVLSLFNSGNNTFEKLSENSGIAEKTLTSVIDSLVAKNILKFNAATQVYSYQSNVNGECVILDGNLLLPCTIIKLKDKILVCRGEWYEFPIDFDTRRIIWNVKIPNKTSSTLVDLIRSSVLKEKKSRIVQLPEHQNLVDKIVPFSKKIGLLIHCVGETNTDVSIIFKIPIIKNSDITPEHRGFKVRTEISTEELLKQLKLPVSERNYEEGIKLNRIFNFSDFVYSQNEIPIELNENGLNYLKITGIKKSFEFTYYNFLPNGVAKKIDTEQYDDSKEAIETLRAIFEKFPKQILSENNFLTEMED